jgi:phosphoribosylformylglycinamidine cyclo-ligase
MLNYKQAGVDIDKANQFISGIKKLIASTRDKNVIVDIGPFAGLYSLKAFKKYKHPVLVASSDGVGTKIKLCILCKKYWVAGYDLVAMNVNDIITSGARPLFFLDYFATSKLHPRVGKEVIKGIVKGCKDSGMSLLGGETAEMPDFYKKGEFDLAGFSLGIVDKDKLVLPDRIKSGDILIGLSSSGPHSNGFSLIRKVFKPKEIRDYWQRYLLKPTRIYVRTVQELLKNINILGMAHITGGGFYDNIPRMLPDGFGVRIFKSWSVPRVFLEIQTRAKISDKEMFRTFNMGIGYVILVSKKDLNKTVKVLKRIGERFYLIGEVVKGKREIIIS